MRLASYLENHPKVARVVYPGLTSHPQHDLARRQMTDFDGNFAPGTLIYFELKGKGEQAKVSGAKMMNFIAKNSPSITLAVSLGQVRSLIEHPASMTHAAVPVAEQARLGIAQGGIRLSVGLESPDDIQRDLATALDQV
jgi:cystathionine beta-lyase/cystathionine gamma-synthase